jgi:hypothetical protein
MRTLDPTRTPEYRAAMAVIVGACTLAALSSVNPAVEHAANLGMAGLGLLGALVAVLRWLLRFVRERLEDAADARTAAAWQIARRRANTTAPAPGGVPGCGP